MERAPVVILTRGEVASLLSVDECIDAVERALLDHAEGASIPPGVLGVHVEGGGFHLKTAGLGRERPYFAAKVNANFPRNRDLHGLPTIQGVILLFDAADGRVLAVMDSIEVTLARTAAATAIAAKHLARGGVVTVTLCGCGSQAPAQARALARTLRFERLFAFDADGGRAAAFAEWAAREFNVPALVAQDLRPATLQSEVIVTCTTAKRAYLTREHVAPGTFVAAVGADNPEKSELEPALLAAGKVVADSLDQCALMGDLHHAIAGGWLTREHVHAELHEIVAGLKPGRSSPDEITIFDSTGTALQDVAAAALVYEKARRLRIGSALSLGS